MEIVVKSKIPIKIISCRLFQLHPAKISQLKRMANNFELPCSLKGDAPNILAELTPRHQSGEDSAARKQSAMIVLNLCANRESNLLPALQSQLAIVANNAYFNALFLWRQYVLAMSGSKCAYRSEIDIELLPVLCKQAPVLSKELNLEMSDWLRRRQSGGVQLTYQGNNLGFTCVVTPFCRKNSPNLKLRTREIERTSHRRAWSL
jgi:hypothetical protein